MNKNYRLLFVDDDQRVLRSLKPLFRRDYDVITATNGEQALEILEHQAIDVIVCDLRMPGMTGDQILSHAQKRYPDLIKILLTGYIDQADIVALKQEVDLYHCIAKPWNEAAIKSLIAEAIATRRRVDNVLSAMPEKTAPVPIQAAEVIVEEQPLTETTIEPESAQVAPIETSMGSKSLKKLSEGMSVLLLENDQEARNAIRGMGKHLGISVYSVSSGLQAAKTVTLKPDIGVALVGVTADPDESLELIDVLREHRDDLAIIALADLANAYIAIELVNKGYAFRYLEKPLGEPEFIRAMASGLKRHTMLKGMDKLGDGGKVEAKPEAQPQKASGTSIRQRLRSLLRSA